MSLNLKLSLLLCLLAMKGMSKDSLLVISYSLSDPPFYMNRTIGEKVIDRLESEFWDVRYVETSKTRIVDSLYKKSKRVVLIEERWTNRIANNCCFGDCGNNKFWTINRRIKVRNKVEMEYLLETLDDVVLLETITKLLKYEDEKPKIFHEKILVIHNKNIEKEENFFKKLKEEFGDKNVSELTFQNRGILNKINYDFIKVVFSFLSKEERVVELIDAKTGRILRRKVI